MYLADAVNRGGLRLLYVGDCLVFVCISNVRIDARVCNVLLRVQAFDRSISLSAHQIAGSGSPPMTNLLSYDFDAACLNTVPGALGDTDGLTSSKRGKILD
jgi:hypothetical protein